MFEKIIVAIDGSPISYRALDVSMELALKFDSSIELVSIVNTNNIPVSVGVSYMPMVNDLEAQTKKHLKVAEQQLKNQEIEYNVICEKGDPRVFISTEVPKNTKADLIVLGKKGKHALETFFIGSVARYVSEKAEIPVLLVD
ncbi:universal stress protein [Companilactobacillus allii]|uniref:UspA domain-containing protein n=1 Tax=Companilactobacillus allii TaxID=1847728 RepID=A0A1P8Q4E8_9LACO|nr:universal stress protein [Companilactobacillus allii]APX72736.1 hypothetical protein BTM29_09320 [Companilactobacillus allii]USQ67522.1 universal stress protein [Companilactobacillus allii]